MPESTVHAILTAVEQLAPDACGAFVIDLGEVSVGTVLAERNRVCWAAHHDLNKRLRELLREGFTCAHEVGKAEALRRALERHTIESLLAMPQEQDEQFSWIDHRHQTYQPRFTFSPADLYVGVNAYLYRAEAVGCEPYVTFAADARAVTFVRSDDAELLPIRVTGELSIAEIDDVGTWASAALGATTRGFPLEVLKRALAASPGEVCVAWQSSRKHTHVAVLADRGAGESLVHALEGHQFPTVVSRRASRSSSAVRDGLGAAHHP